MRDIMSITKEQMEIIRLLRTLGDDKIAIINPNVRVERVPTQPTIISILEVSCAALRGFNGDNGKFASDFHIMLGIKSVSDEPLKDLNDLQKRLLDLMKANGYKEGLSSISYDDTGLPVLYNQFIIRKYEGKKNELR